MRRGNPFGVTAPGRRGHKPHGSSDHLPLSRGEVKEGQRHWFFYSIHYLLDTHCVQGTLPSPLEDSKMIGRVAGQRKWGKYANSPILKENKGWGEGRVEFRGQGGHLCLGRQAGSAPRRMALGQT